MYPFWVCSMHSTNKANCIGHAVMPFSSIQSYTAFWCLILIVFPSLRDKRYTHTHFHRNMLHICLKIAWFLCMSVAIIHFPFGMYRVLAWNRFQKKKTVVVVDFALAFISIEYFYFHCLEVKCVEHGKNSGEPFAHWFIEREKNCFRYTVSCYDSIIYS